MNKKYMDFVPVRSNGERGTSKIVTVQTTQTEVVSLVEREAPNLKPADLNRKFVKTDVPKRPLSRRPEMAQNDLAVLKAQNVKSKRVPRPLKRAEKMPAGTTGMSLNSEPKKNVYQAPKNPFINQGKIVKRPLSRNVYLKELEENSEPIVEKHEEPVMVASKTEKKSHWKTVLAIIVTILVGAAAGVAAFLLLPK